MLSKLVSYLPNESVAVDLRVDAPAGELRQPGQGELILRGGEEAPAQHILVPRRHQALGSRGVVHCDEIFRS